MLLPPVAFVLTSPRKHICPASAERMRARNELRKRKLKTDSVPKICPRKPSEELREGFENLSVCNCVLAADEKMKICPSRFFEKSERLRKCDFFVNECPKRKLVRPLNKNLLVCTSVPQLVVTFGEFAPFFACPSYAFER